MAKNTDSLQRDLNQLVASLDKLGVNTRQFKTELEGAKNNQQALVALSEKLVRALDSADNSATSLYSSLKAAVDEVGNKNKQLNKTESLLNKVLSDTRKLRDDEQGIVDLSKSQLNALQERLKVNKNLLKDQVHSLQKEQDYVDLNKKGANKLKDAEKLRLDRYKAAIKSAEDDAKLIEQAIQSTKDRLALERSISKNMGVTGALVKGTGALMERLGMRSGIFHDAMQDAYQAMRDQSKALGKNATYLDRMEIAAKGFSILAKGFGAALTDPAIIIASIISKFVDLNKASVKLQRLTGQVNDKQAAHNKSLASGAQVLEVMAEMTARSGIAASAMFSSEDLGRLTEAKNLLGLSSEQASSLGMLSKASGTSIQGYKEQVVASVNEFNALNDSAVAHGVIMQDVLNASADISMSLGGNSAKITAAAAAARKLGVELAKVNQIADGLLDFESSISNELEAQLLTGKNINLNKARELALNNDLEGVAKELAKNGATAAEFAKMNRIQQDAMAKSLGMSREEMGKMLIIQKGQENLTDKQRAAMRGVTLEQLEQMEATESLQLAFSKIAEPLASILSSLTPIVTMIAKAVAFVAPLGKYVLGAVIALKTALGVYRSILAVSKLITLLQSQGAAKALLANKLSQAGLLTEKQKAFWQGRQTYFANLKNGIAQKNLIIENASLKASVRKTALDKLQVLYSKLKLAFDKSSLKTIIMQIGRLGIQLGIQLGIASAALLTNAAMSLGIGAAIAVGAALAAFAMFKSKKADDMVSPGYGERTLIGPEGAIALNNKDTVIAGTNLFPESKRGNESKTVNPLNMEPLIQEIKGLRQEMISLLNTVSQGGDVFLDSDKIGRTQAKFFSKTTGS